MEKTGVFLALSWFRVLPSVLSIPFILLTLPLYSLSPEEQQLVWANRIACPTHLGTYPRGLPVVLLSTPHWHPSTQVLADVEAVLGVWPRHDPTFGLELLDAQYVELSLLPSCRKEDGLGTMLLLINTKLTI